MYIRSKGAADDACGVYAVLFRFGGVVGAIQDGAGWRMMCA